MAFGWKKSRAVTVKLPPETAESKKLKRLSDTDLYLMLESSLIHAQMQLTSYRQASDTPARLARIDMLMNELSTANFSAAELLSRILDQLDAT